MRISRTGITGMSSRYYRMIGFSCLVMIVAIVALAYALYNQGPRVRLVRFESDSKTALTKNSTITISFDRPLLENDYSQAIRITPDIPFSVRVSGQSIFVMLQENLKHQTKYKLAIDPVIVDKSGKRMRSSYVHTLESAYYTPRYAYLERNYGAGAESQYGSIDAEDHIKIGTLGEDAEVIFSRPEIRSFVANSEYVTVVAREETMDSLYTISMQTGEVREERLVSSGYIDNLALSPYGRLALFTVRPDYKLVSQEFYKAYANIVYALDVETGLVTSLTDASGDSLRAVGIVMDEGGQVALVQDSTQTFYAVSPFND